MSTRLDRHISPETFGSYLFEFIPERLFLSRSSKSAFSSNIISQSILPGLQCLLNDVRSVAPEHEVEVASMIREFEAKTEVMKPVVERQVHL